MNKIFALLVVCMSVGCVTPQVNRWNHVEQAGIVTAKIGPWESQPSDSLRSSSVQTMMNRCGGQLVSIVEEGILVGGGTQTYGSLYGGVYSGYTVEDRNYFWKFVCSGQYPEVRTGKPVANVTVMSQRKAFGVVSIMTGIPLIGLGAIAMGYGAGDPSNNPYFVAGAVVTTLGAIGLVSGGIAVGMPEE